MHIELRRFSWTLTGYDPELTRDVVSPMEAEPLSPLYGI